MWARLSIIVAALLLEGAAIAQDNWGKIIFYNRNIPTRADPKVLYNVPIYAPGGSASGTGAGNLPGGVTLGLFPDGSADNATAIVSTKLRTGTPVQALFFVDSPIAMIPGVAPGNRANLLVRMWQGESFASAKNSCSSLLWGEWAFTSQPLGGSAPDGGTEIPIPSMTGWGPENGTGLEIIGIVRPPVPPPSITWPPTNSKFSAPATITITGEAKPSSCFSVTNLIVMTNGVMLSQATATAGATNTIVATTAPLPLGSYRLTVVAEGFWTYSLSPDVLTTDAYINVIEPLPITLTTPKISGGLVNFNYSADAGIRYVVEASEDMFSWRPRYPTNTAPSNAVTVIDAIDPIYARYYRVRLANP